MFWMRLGQRRFRRASLTWYSSFAYSWKSGSSRNNQIYSRFSSVISESREGFWVRSQGLGKILLDMMWNQFNCIFCDCSSVVVSVIYYYCQFFYCFYQFFLEKIFISSLIYKNYIYIYIYLFIYIYFQLILSTL